MIGVLPRGFVFTDCFFGRGQRWLKDSYKNKDDTDLFWPRGSGLLYRILNSRTLSLITRRRNNFVKNSTRNCYFNWWHSRTNCELNLIVPGKLLAPNWNLELSKAIQIFHSFVTYLLCYGLRHFKPLNFLEYLIWSPENINTVIYHATPGQDSFSRILNADWSIQISGSPSE